MIKLKAILQLIFLLNNTFFLGLYSIFFRNVVITDLLLKETKVKNKITKRDIKSYLNNCYKSS